MSTVPGICYRRPTWTPPLPPRAPHPPQPRPPSSLRKKKKPEASAAHRRTRSSPLLFPTLSCVLAGPPPQTFPGGHRPRPPPDTPTRPCSQSRKTATGLALRRRCTPPPRHIRVFIAGTKSTGFFCFPASFLAKSHAQRTHTRRLSHSTAATLPSVMDGGGASHWLGRQPRLPVPRPACGDATASAVASCVPPCPRGLVAAHGR